MQGLREKQKTTRQQKILSTAHTLFKAKGYAATTVKEIADGAELSHATVFKYYNSKGELLLALISDRTHDILQELEQIVNSKVSDPHTKVTRFLAAITSGSLALFDKEAWRYVVATTVMSGQSEFGKTFMKLRLEIRNALTRLLCQLRSENVLPHACKPEILADVFYQIHYAIFVELVTNESMTIQDYQRRMAGDVGHVLELILFDKRE